MSNTPYEAANDNGGSSNSFVLGVICGAAAGAALALLFAPKPGTELRRQIANSAEDWRKKAGDVYSDASGKVASAVDRGKNVVSDAMKTGKTVVNDAVDDASGMVASAVDRGKNVVNDAMKSGKNVVNEAVDQGREAIERGKAAYKNTVADQPPTSSSPRPHGLT